VGQSNPHAVLKEWKDAGCFTDPIDVGPFVDMLKAQGMYRASHQVPVTPTVPEMDSATAAFFAREQIIDALNNMRVYPSATMFATWLEYARDECLHFLIRLPVTLKALDFLTKVLTSNVFEAMTMGIEAHDIAREYLQHALRKIEILGSRPSTPTSSHSSGTPTSRFFRSGTPTFGNAATSSDFLDKEEQARTIGLLIVFLRNIIARGVLDLSEAFLDVQEICIRYIWVPQVREFRAWLEEVTGVDAFGGGVMLELDD
jgi:CCR4-NOT transcription complex subunit 11